ncbi:claudin-23-like [Brachyhypopomus gauderio]|uniref:claudin-23-like n=1 Tax=Brachyhypopomus gauderio TaxID=698409 RepID=UPI0040437FE3
MRTPGILIFGLVFSPCGWILDLTSTVAPGWRSLSSVAGQSVDTVVNQGIWDICYIHTTSNEVTCNKRDTDSLYFSNQIITIARGMMVASLVVTAIGLAILTPGVRCWSNQKPRWVLASMGGLLIFCSGVLTIIPIAWYTRLLPSLNTTTTFVNPQSPQINVGYCIVLGYIGGIMEVLAGVVIFVGICRCCGGRNRGEYPQHTNPPITTSRPARPTPRPRTNVPRSVASSISSVPYSRNTLDDDLDFPRPKSHYGKGTVNPSYSGRPYDADL